MTALPPPHAKRSAGFYGDPVKIVALRLRLQHVLRLAPQFNLPLLNNRPRE